MNISSKPFTNHAKLKNTFRQLGEKSAGEQALVDQVEIRGEALLKLDGTSLDQDEAPGSVAVEHGGLLGYAQANPFGGLISVDILDERGEEVQEFSKSMDMTSSVYSTTQGEATREVRVNDGGFIALTQRLDTLA